MSNPWFRLYSEFATDPKVQMMSESYQRRFIMLLCIRCNSDVTLQDEEVAFQLRISNEEWAETKAVFVAKELIDSDNSPLAWDRRQFVSDSSAARVAKHREKKKNACNVTVTPPDTDSDTELETSSLVVSELTPCPHQEIISLYAEILPELPQVRKWEGTRAKNLKARWSWVLADLKAKGKPFDKSAGLDFFRRMFGYIHKSDFMMGRSGGFSCSLPWIVNHENFTKIIEGNYENKAVAA